MKDTKYTDSNLLDIAQKSYIENKEFDSISKTVKQISELEENNIDLLARDPENGTTAMHIAAKNNNTLMMNSLLTSAKTRDEKSEKSAEKDTKLLAKEILELTDEEGLTPLHYAVKNNNFEAVALLVNEANADIDIKDEDGLTPFCHAVLSKNRQMAEFLTNKTINSEKKEEELKKERSLTLNQHANPNRTINGDGYTIAHLIIKAGKNIKIITEMLNLAENLQVNICTKDNDNNTIAHIISLNSNLSVNDKNSLLQTLSHTHNNLKTDKNKHNFTPQECIEDENKAAQSDTSLNKAIAAIDNILGKNNKQTNQVSLNCLKSGKSSATLSNDKHQATDKNNKRATITSQISLNQESSESKEEANNRQTTFKKEHLSLEGKFLSQESIELVNNENNVRQKQYNEKRHQLHIARRRRLIHPCSPRVEAVINRLKNSLIREIYNQMEIIKYPEKNKSTFIKAIRYISILAELAPERLKLAQSPEIEWQPRKQIQGLLHKLIELSEKQLQEEAKTIINAINNTCHGLDPIIERILGDAANIVGRDYEDQINRLTDNGANQFVVLATKRILNGLKKNLLPANDILPSERISHALFVGESKKHLVVQEKLEVRDPVDKNSKNWTMRGVVKRSRVKIASEANGYKEQENVYYARGGKKYDKHKKYGSKWGTEHATELLLAYTRYENGIAIR